MRLGSQKAVNLMKKKYNTDELPFIINKLLFFRIAFTDIIITVKQIILAIEKEKNLLIRTLAFAHV